MATPLEALIRANPLYRRLSEEDRVRVAAVAELRAYSRGQSLFSEGDPSSLLFTLVDGRVKMVKILPAGKEVILEIFGPGDPVGAVAAFESLPYPASAVALEDTRAIVVRSAAFFRLLETCPTLVKGLLVGLSFRLVDLTRRIAEVAGSRVEARFGHLFLKLADRLGQTEGNAIFIPLVLSRQDLADLTGTTIETAIRIMSRWNKEGVIATEKDGFRVPDRSALEALVLY